MTTAEGGVATVDWRDETLVVEGREWSYRETGHGETVLLLDPPGLSGSGSGPLGQLADGHRLIETALLPDGAADEPSAREAARRVRRFLQAAGVTRVAVVSRGSTSPVALWLAIEDPTVVTTLVLESPPRLSVDALIGEEAELLAAMASLEVPTLVLLGQGAAPAPPEYLTTYRRLPASTVALVYDADEDVRGERPSAYLSAVTDYLQRGQAFIVSNRSTVIHA